MIDDAEAKKIFAPALRQACVFLWTKIGLISELIEEFKVASAVQKRPVLEQIELELQIILMDLAPLKSSLNRLAEHNEMRLWLAKFAKDLSECKSLLVKVRALLESPTLGVLSNPVGRWRKNLHQIVTALDDFVLKKAAFEEALATEVIGPGSAFLPATSRRLGRILGYFLCALASIVVIAILMKFADWLGVELPAKGKEWLQLLLKWK